MGLSRQQLGEGLEQRTSSSAEAMQVSDVSAMASRIKDVIGRAVSSGAKVAGLATLVAGLSTCSPESGESIPSLAKVEDVDSKGQDQQTSMILRREFDGNAQDYATFAVDVWFPKSDAYTFVVVPDADPENVVIVEGAAIDNGNIITADGRFNQETSEYCVDVYQGSFEPGVIPPEESRVSPDSMIGGPCTDSHKK